MKNILQYFEKTCDRFPDHIAVADDHASVTFHDLKRKSQQTGTMLASTLKKHRIPVAIYMGQRQCSAFFTVVIFMSYLTHRCL